MLEQIFRVILEFAAGFDLSIETARRVFQNATHSMRDSPYRLREAVKFQTLLQISEILGAWYCEPAFLDETGAPRPLPLQGPRSFGTLVRRFLPRFKPRDIASILIAEHQLARLANGDLTPVRRVAGFPNANTLMLDRIPALLQGMLSTLGHNIHPNSRRRGTRCERGTTLLLPAEAIPQFHERTKDLAQQLLNQIDAWASKRQRSMVPKSTQKIAQVGIEIFGYVDETPDRPRRRRSR